MKKGDIKMEYRGFEERLKESKVEWKIKKFADADAYRKGESFEESSFDGNVMLNEGLNEMWTILCSAGGTKFDNTNAYLGVGTDTTSAAATDTGLIANPVYVGMESGYPTYGTSQKATWKASFDGDTANQAWNEFTVAAGDSNGVKNLNRKVSAQGTKVSGQVWVLQLEITLS
jgi:hypothetical protein